jgi:hypothetical protein
MMKLPVIGVAIAVGLVVAFGLYLFGIGLRNVGRAVARSPYPTTPVTLGSPPRGLVCMPRPSGCRAPALPSCCPPHSPCSFS